MTALSDLRAAVARADEVLGCGAMPCRFKATTGQTTNGRCVCLDHPRAGHVLAALYKAVKAAVEQQPVPVRGIDQATLEPYVNREVEFMCVRGTIKGLKMTSSCMTPMAPRCEVTTKSNEEVRRLWEATLGLDNVLKTCWCFQCLDDPSMGLLNPTMVRMIVCPQCGNKRCPRATSHDNACSGSNEPVLNGSGK